MRAPLALLSASFLAATLCLSSSAQATEKLGVRETWKRIKEEMHVYRGPMLEKLSDRFSVGKSDFDGKRSVAQNLEHLVQQKQIPHYYADIEGRKVLHVVVDLASPKSVQTIRSTMKRVGADTVELNYKASTAKNPYGHVAMRVGDGATYDLTGTQGTAELPRFFSRVIKAVRGADHLSFGRRRNLRRFFESRKAGPDVSASLFYGLLFKASPDERKATKEVYDARLRGMKAFNVGGGDASKGEYSCAQFLTHEVPFLNARGVSSTIGAKSMVSAAKRSTALEAVLVYRTPGVTDEAMKASLP